MTQSWLEQQVRRSPAFPFLKWALWRVHMARDWWGTRVWTKTTAARSPDGFVLEAGYHPAYKQMLAGTFEPDEHGILRRALSAADVFVDIGANIGLYSLLAASKGVHVVAFEPQPHNVQVLMRNLEANGYQPMAEVFPVALSDCPGVLTLYGASGPSASLVKGWAEYSPRYQQRVPVSTLDTVLGHRFDGKRLVFKIDVEGAEWEVLRGAARTLDAFPNSLWLIEVCLVEFHPAGRSPNFRAVFEAFFSRGYKAFVANASRDPVSLADVDRWFAEGRTDTGVFNYMFVGPGADGYASQP